MAVPNFADIAKASNDLLNKDFYHLSASTFELKSNAPNNVAFKVTGKTSHEKATAGALEGKYVEKGTGLTLTQTWTTTNALDTKVELADTLAKGFKAEGIFSFLPATHATGAKLNLHFKQPNFHGRAFFDLLKGPVANIDAVVGHEGFLAGASAGYDVNKAAVTNYSATVGFTTPAYTAAIAATENLSVFAASYYHKVNSQVEAGAKATWNVQGRATTSVSRLPASTASTPSLLPRSRSTTAVLPPSPTTSSSGPASLSVSVPRSIPRSWTRPPTRLAPASPLRVKQFMC